MRGSVAARGHCGNKVSGHTFYCHSLEVATQQGSPGPVLRGESPHSAPSEPHQTNAPGSRCPAFGGSPGTPPYSSPYRYPLRKQPHLSATTGKVSRRVAHRYRPFPVFSPRNPHQATAREATASYGEPSRWLRGALLAIGDECSSIMAKRIGSGLITSGRDNHALS